MIYDSITNLSSYLCMHTHFPDAAAFLNKHAGYLHELQPGTYEINSKGAYASVSEYETKPAEEGFIEFHRKFIDIQIIIEGRERIGIAHKAYCTELEYSDDKDFGKLEGIADFITLDTHNFVIFFPQDGHMPQISFSDKSDKVIKIVFKIPVSA